MMNRNKRYYTILTAMLIALFVSIAFCLRVWFVHNMVFAGGEVIFTETDAYYHMRLVDNLLHHFPLRITFDPYTNYPHGSTVDWPPFFDWLIGGIAWLAGLGSPNQHTAEMVGAFLPAILGAATVIPVYFVGRELFHRLAGILAAALIAVHPGGFLMSSTLGYADHHVAEALFSTTAILFLIISLKHSQRLPPAFADLRSRRWETLRKPLLYSLLSGLVLGVYLLTWSGGVLLIVLVLAYILVQSIIDHLRGQSSEYLAIITFPMLLVAGALSLSTIAGIWSSRTYIPFLAISLLTPVILAALSRALAERRIKPIYYPVIVLGTGMIGLLLIRIASPPIFDSIVWPFRYVMGRGIPLAIWEAQPLFFPLGHFSLADAWAQFTTGFYLSLVSLALLVHAVARDGKAHKTLFLVWSLTMLLAVLGQRRFAYYFAVNVALLTGYLSWQVLKFAGFKERPDEPLQSRHKKDKTVTIRSKRHVMTPVARRLNMGAGVMVLLTAFFLPSAGEAVAQAAKPAYAPHAAWTESLNWMRDNTPDPFSNPSFYYDLYQPPSKDHDYDYPDSAYGVMAWWTYGHWITRIAHRIPIANPFMDGVRPAASFFTAQDESSAARAAEGLGMKYIIVDDNLATGFYAIASVAGLSEKLFYDVYYQRQQDTLVPVQLFHPEYYRSMAVRLYNFDGRPTPSGLCTVISYEERGGREGQRLKEITISQMFANYEQATAYISKQTSGNYRIVSANPFMSPVPLEGLRHYRLVYSSSAEIERPGAGIMPRVKVFEYSP